MPLARSLTKFPDSWLLPLIPIALRILIAACGKLSSVSHTPCGVWTSMRRMVFYFCIFQFRGWGLYVWFNMLEKLIINTYSDVSGTSQSSEESCWYTPLLKNRWQVSDPCHGLQFDFSDHVVLFFSHHFPTIVFEALFCALFPFWPDANKTKDKTDNPRNGGDTASSSMVQRLLNTILPLALLFFFLYLNFVTLLAVHSTAAYFHSLGEISVGYLISLLVQIPVGKILWADGWNRMRHLVGFPYDREHVE